MNRDVWRVGAVVIGLWAGVDVGAAESATPNKPGSDKVCVPGENGKGWVCGTRDNPPQVAPGTPSAAERAAPTPQPPPFLANPNRRYSAPPATIERPAETQALADDDLPAAQDLPAASSAPPPAAETGKSTKVKDKAHASSAATAAAPTTAPAPATTRAAVTAPTASASEAVPQPTSASTERAAVETLPDAAPSAAPAVVAAPAEAPATPAAAPPAPAEDATPVATAVTAPPPAPSSRRAAPTSELPDDGYVIQLARGNSNHGFEQIRGKLKLDRQRTPEIRVGSAAAPEHVLLWSGFADSKSAQAALNKLPKGAAPGAWVRSVESLRPLLVDAGAAPSAAPRTAATPAEPAPVATTAPAPAPVPATAPAPAIERQPAMPAEAVADAPATAPVVTARGAAGTLSNTTVSAFAALPGGHYAVQLARAHSTAGFAPLVGTLGIPESSVYSVPVKTTGKLEYLLLWADFPSVEAARAAAARLPASAVQGALARRIGPLQEEARGAR